ncbi:hypothetical protein [Actinomyces ruminis]|uniref:hypothetical protein n=1 Tax=Actinomyces ruminis TaxID=1937003 RepID=UPI0015D4FE10|nr:hypothetical protein [Actinomyces ruminis]
MTTVKAQRSATANPSWRALTDGATARAARRPAPRPAGESSGRPELRVVRGVVPSGAPCPSWSWSSAYSPARWCPRCC